MEGSEGYERRGPFQRYVAIGDSTTEGLMDPDGHGGHIGWADRLAQLIADSQDDPLEYANLAVRGLHLDEIRNTQFDDAIAMAPDLMTIFGGVNDVIAFAADFDEIRRDYALMFGEARARDITVLTFTMPDPTPINPFGSRMRDKMFMLNDIIRAEADRYGVLVLDFQGVEVAEDPRMWFEDRLHGNTLGHIIVAAALAYRLGLPGADRSWADPIGAGLEVPRPSEKLRADVDWTVKHLGPWLGKGLRGIRTGQGIVAKRPVPTVVPKSSPQSSPEDSGEQRAADEGAVVSARRDGEQR